jgi:hypothetical protein
MSTDQKDCANLDVGEQISFVLTEDTKLVRNRLYAHARYHGKKFKTWTVYNSIVVLRVE